MLDLQALSDMGMRMSFEEDFAWKKDHMSESEKDLKRVFDTIDTRGME